MRQSSQGFLITISTLTSHSYFCRTSTGGESDISVTTLKQEVFVNNYFQFSLCFAKIQTMPLYHLVVMYLPLQFAKQVCSCIIAFFTISLAT